MRWMMILAMLTGAVGCNVPSVPFQGIAPTRVSVDGSLFEVRVKGHQAQAIRVNPTYAPRFGPIRLRAATAMQWASGCRVLDVTGDQALAEGRLDCGQGAAPAQVVPLALDCVPERGSGIYEIQQVRIALDCSL